jgi:hypothetical protein
MSCAERLNELHDLDYNAIIEQQKKGESKEANEEFLDKLIRNAYIDRASLVRDIKKSNKDVKIANKAVPKIKKKALKYDADTLDDAVENGDITYERARQIASEEGINAGLISKEEAAKWNEGDEDIDVVEANDRFFEQMNGIIAKFGTNSAEHQWAMKYLERHPTFDQLVEENGFTNTVRDLMKSDSLKSEVSLKDDMTFQGDRNTPEGRQQWIDELAYSNKLNFLIKAGKDPLELVKHIAKKHPDPAFRKLADMIVPRIEQHYYYGDKGVIKVISVDKTDLAQLDDADKLEGAFGLFTFDRSAAESDKMQYGIVRIDEAVLSEENVERVGPNKFAETFLHEMIHAATASQILAYQYGTLDMNSQMYEDISELDAFREKALESLESQAFDRELTDWELHTATTVLSNLHETMTYALTNPRYREVFNSIIVGKEGDSLWTKISKFIHKLMKIPYQAGSMLSKTLESFGRLTTGDIKYVEKPKVEEQPIVTDDIRKIWAEAEATLDNIFGDDTDVYRDFLNVPPLLEMVDAQEGGIEELLDLIDELGYNSDGSINNDKLLVSDFETGELQTEAQIIADMFNIVSNQHGFDSPQAQFLEYENWVQGYLDSLEMGKSPEEAMRAIVAQDLWNRDLKSGIPDWAKPTVLKVMTKGKVEKKIKEVFGKIPENVEVVQNWRELPFEPTETFNEDARAFYRPTDGKIYINASKMREGDMINTVYHEMVHAVVQRENKNWKTMVDHVRRAAARGEDLAKRAVEHAARVVSAERLERDPDAIDKETLAYMMTFAPEASLTKRITARLKELMSKMFKVDLTSEEIVQMLKAEIDAKVDTQEQQLYNAKMDERVEEGVFTQDEAYEFEQEAKQSEDPEFTVTTQVTTERAAWNTSEAAMTTAKTAGRNIKDAILGFIPMRPLLDMLNKLMPDYIDVNKIQTWYNRADAAANARIEEANEGVLRDFHNFQRNNKPEYERLVKFMLHSTRNNVDGETLVDFDTFSPEAQQLYKDVRDHYRTMAADKIAALRTNLALQDFSPEKKAELSSIIDEMEKNYNKTKVYFPFSRFGKYSVKAKDADGSPYVAHYDTQAEAEKAAQKMERMPEYSNISVGMTRPTQESLAQVMTPEAFDAASRFIEEMGGDEDSQQALWDTFVHFSPQSAAYRRQLRRRSINGMSEDMVRGLNQSINKDIRANELMRVMPEVDKITKQANDYIRTMDNSVEATKLMNEIQKRAKTKDPRSGWSKGITKLNFLYYLGFNPASALINMTQNAIVGVPVLSADFGFGVWKDIGREMSHAMRHFRDHETMGYEGIEKLAFQRMKKDQVIDVTNAHMMADLNEGYSGDKDPDSAANKFMRGSAWMFHNAEIVNRAGMSMAAFKLHYAKHNDFEAAVKYASDKTYESHFDFSERGKSRWQQTDAGNVLLALKSYPINMAVYFARNFNRWLMDSDATPQEKREAKYQLLGTMGITMLLGGFGALPFAGILPEIYMSLFGDDDETPEHAMREGLMAIFGNEAMVDVILDGAVGTATGLDIQSKVSLGLDMFARVQGGQSPEEMLDTVLEGTMGPAYAAVNNFMRGFGQMADGKMTSGITTMLPTSLRNVIKSGVGMERGIAQTAYDTKIEDFDAMDAFWKAAGFNSAEYADYFEEARHERRLTERKRSKKTYLLRELAVARTHGDNADVREARKAIREWNRTVPKEDRITQSTMKRSITNYRKKITGED